MASQMQCYCERTNLLRYPPSLAGPALGSPYAAEHARDRLRQTLEPTQDPARASTRRHHRLHGSQARQAPRPRDGVRLAQPAALLVARARPRGDGADPRDAAPRARRLRARRARQVAPAGRVGGRLPGRQRVARAARDRCHGWGDRRGPRRCWDLGPHGTSLRRSRALRGAECPPTRRRCSTR